MRAPYGADYTGRKFGKLLAIRDTGKRRYLFVCDCGEKVIRPINSVRGGDNPMCKSCKSEVARQNGYNNRTHGFSKTKPKLYDVHRQMMQRCYNLANKDYPNYGGRGIKVCEDWHDIGKFIEWAELSGYKDKVTIERLDVNGNYCPNNCSWIVNERQALNTRKVRLYTYRGVTKTISDWAEEYNLTKYTLKGRLNLGWDMEETLKLPPAFGRNQFRKV